MFALNVNKRVTWFILNLGWFRFQKKMKSWFILKDGLTEWIESIVKILQRNFKCDGERWKSDTFDIQLNWFLGELLETIVKVV